MARQPTHELVLYEKFGTHDDQLAWKVSVIVHPEEEMGRHYVETMDGEQFPFYFDSGEKDFKEGHIDDPPGQTLHPSTWFVAKWKKLRKPRAK